MDIKKNRDKKNSLYEGYIKKIKIFFSKAVKISSRVWGKTFINISYWGIIVIKLKLRPDFDC